MKVESETTKSFALIKLSITIESEAEQAELYALFNHSSILEALPAIRPSSEDLREAIAGEFSTQTKYEPAFNRLTRLIKD